MSYGLELVDDGAVSAFRDVDVGGCVWGMMLESLGEK
jgi:hypothetical protein